MPHPPSGARAQPIGPPADDLGLACSGPLSLTESNRIVDAEFVSNGGGKDGVCNPPSIPSVRGWRGCRADLALGGGARGRLRHGRTAAGEVRPAPAVTRKRDRGGEWR